MNALLDARLIVDRGTFHLDLPLAVAPGEVVALLGPNGAGKTTALRALAGLLPLRDGHIRLAGRPLDDPAARVWVRPERRPIGVVFQDYLLFPHLTVLDNVAFGPRCRGAGRAESRRRASAWLARVDLLEYAQRKPRRLSGGQGQRVALARALAVEPELLLLDEPLSALDAKTRLEVRAQLRTHLAGHPGATVLVTHDPLDAMVLADRIVIVEQGRVVQEGDALSITRQPRTEYVAQLVGLNLYRGVADGTRVTVAGGFTLSTTEPYAGDVFVAFPPSAVALFRTRPVGSPRNTWQATVDGVEQRGAAIRIQLGGPVPASADVTPASAAELNLVPGEQLWAAVKATETHAYPA